MLQIWSSKSKFTLKIFIPFLFFLLLLVVKLDCVLLISIENRGKALKIAAVELSIKTKGNIS
jgi:hypothetical protein